tara:strand:+ start:1179 stop:2000 length:822 start_codon:yes stop_codon:yes gene_type:complete
MKIFLFGSTGMLGNYVFKYLSNHNKHIICINRNELDVSDITYDKLSEVIIKYNPNEGDIIINCIGIIPQSNNNVYLHSYFTINSLFPNMLSTFSYINNLRFIHITTDCVFSGLKGDYTELDEHDEINEYGVSKSLGEKCIKSTIIRTSIIGEELNNKYSLLEWVKKHNNTELNGFINHKWNGVTCLELSKIINNMIDNNIYWTGVRHIYSPNSVTKYELVSMINNIYELNNTIKEFKTCKNIDKTLTTIYDTNELFNIKDLKYQIIELKEYII